MNSINNTMVNITQLNSSDLPVGAIITHCNTPGTIALTFDDGPYIYTSQLLDTLAEHGVRATFFLNGHNKGSIDAFPEVVERTLAEGHQIGSHTFVDAIHPPSLHQLSLAQPKHQYTLTKLSSGGTTFLLTPFHTKKSCTK